MVKQVDVTDLLPKFVRILHTKYKVNVNGGTKLALKSRLGEIDFNEREINVLNIGGSNTVDTFIHEMLHGLYYIFDLGEDIDEEEHIISTLASGLTTIMKDNPKLFAKLQYIIDSEE